MYRPSRIRRIAKWSGVVVCVVLVAGWVVSLRWGIAYALGRLGRSDLEVSIAWGGINLVRFPPGSSRLREGGFEFVRFEGWMTAWLPMFSSMLGGSVLFIPMWMPLGAVALPTAYLFHRDRRHPRGHCKQCGYDLQGNESGVCPECGRAISNAT